MLLSTTILTATEDAHVQAGGFGDTNFNEHNFTCALPLAGTSCMVVRNDNGTNTGGLTRIAYLKFDTTGLAGAVNSATLRLFGLVASPANESPKNDDVHGVADTTWSETTITYNNRPIPDGAVLDSQAISGNTLKAYNWNVVGWASGHFGGPIAFAVQEATQGALSHLYRTHEWTTDSQRPKLILSVGAPDAPNGLTGTAGNSSVTLNWSLTEADGQPVDATSWSVYRGTSVGSEQQIANGITTNSYIDNTATNGTDYFYYVVATNGSGDSPASAEIGPLRPTVSTVGPPNPIRVTEGIGTINLSWDPVPFANTYKIYRSDTSGGTFVLQTEQAGTSFDDAVGPGIKFYYKVSAVNSAGEGPLSPEIAATGGILGSGNGISATYYDNIDFTGATVTRDDPNINFDFDACCAGSPDPAIGPDTYSARWLGDVQAEYTQPYTFYTRSDDGARLWVDDKLVVDAWIDQGATTWASAPESDGRAEISHPHGFL